MDRLKELWKTTPFRIALVVLLLLVLGIGYYFASVPVKAGTKVICRYGHTIRDDTYTLRVPKFLAGRFKVDEEKSVCAKHARAEKLYAQAQRELAGKKYSQAKKTLKKVEKTVPKFKQTKSQLAAINRLALSGNDEATNGGSPEAPGSDAGETNGSSNTDTGGANADTSGANAGNSVETPDGETGEKDLSPVEIDLAALLPQGDIPGYTRGTLLKSGNSTQLDFLPTAATRTKINSLLITVRDMDSADGAKNFIENTSKIAWPDSQKNPSIKGKKAYFGTNIYGYANLSWSNDVIVYEIQMLSAEATPLDLYDDIVKIVDYLP